MSRTPEARFGLDRRAQTFGIDIAIERRIARPPKGFFDEIGIDGFGLAVFDLGLHGIGTLQKQDGRLRRIHFVFLLLRSVILSGNV